MKRALLGVIGHVDHGKTTLVRTLTGMETDRLAEEKSRGISIALGFAHFRPDAETEIALVDMPGHERFVRTMISGAIGIDAVLLVVAANEGIKPQTIEHLDIAALLGLKQAVVVLTKSDLATDEEITTLGDDVSALLETLGIEATAPIPVAAGTSRGIASLIADLTGLAARSTADDQERFACLPIDRAFSIAGHGAVVTGTLQGSGIAAGDELELWPGQRIARVRAVQVHGEQVDLAPPRQRVALNLRDVPASELARGMRLAAPGALAPSEWVTMTIRSVEGAPPLRNGMRLRALLGTDECDVRLRLLDRDILDAGESGFAQLHCERDVALIAREPVILRVASPARTVAGGMVLEPVTRRKRRNCPEVLDRLAHLAALPPERLIAHELAVQPAGTVSLRDLSLLIALPPDRIETMLVDLPFCVTRKGRIVSHAEIERLRAEVLRVLERHREGLSSKQLQTALPGTRLAVLDEVLARMGRDGAITRTGGHVRLPRPEEDAAEAQDEERLVARIADDLRRAGLTPPNPGAILVDARAKRAIGRLQRQGLVIRCVDRAKGREILFHKDAIEEAQNRLEPMLAGGQGMLATEIASALGISRKFTMPLLDHLDAIQFTRRDGDRRYLWK